MNDVYIRLRERYRAWVTERNFETARAKMESTELPRGAFHHSDS